MDSHTDAPLDRAQLDRVVAVINGKGGVGKTSTVANVAGQIAAGGLPTLAIDLDLSGNLALDLGYTDQADDGRSLTRAITDGDPLPILHNVRPGLDVIAGGRYLEQLAALAMTPMAEDLPGGGVGPAFAALVATVADDYELIIMDCAPGNPVLQDMALVTARYVLIPTKTDAAGWDGLRMIGPRVRRARRSNPDVTYLGALLFGHSPGATRVLRNTRARLAEVQDTIPLLDTVIRHSEGAAHDCRRRGQLAHELAADVQSLNRERLAALQGVRRGAVLEVPQALSGTADSLAGDYAALSRELLSRISRLEQGKDAVVETAAPILSAVR